MNTANLLDVKDVILHSHTEYLENEVAKILRNEDPERIDTLLKK